MSRFVSIGLPESGKTTYLAALWHVLESHEVSGSLELASALQVNREYLNTIRDAWIDFQPVPRTLVPQGGVSFHLREEEAGVLGEVDFPDLPGESFRSQWTEREWSEDFDQLIRAADGFLLFLHPSFMEGRRIIDVDRSLGLRADGREAGRTEVKWDPERAPTAVQVVELLQFLVDAWARTPPIPAAIVISAWDRVEVLAETRGDAPPAPEEWIAARMPLLSQYLRANPEWFRSRVYGISAQGGEFTKEGDRERMMEHLVTSDRIRVVDADGESHDPTRPLRWLLAQATRP